jgi:hypothetical protein
VGIGYRLGQFWRNMTAAPLSPEAMGAVTAVLTTEELALFNRFSLSDQQHSYQVLYSLQTAGWTQPSLLKAALLHDVGKSCISLKVWERSLAVLLAMVAPQRMEAWGQGEAQGWRRPFVVKAQHPAWGADMVAAIGGDSLTVDLIRHHQDNLGETADSPEERLLRLLQWADNQN